MSQQNGKVKTKGRLKLVRALELRSAGLSYRQIADALGVSRASAWRIVTRGLDELTAKCAEKAEQVKALELVRLDAMRVLPPDWRKATRLFRDRRERAVGPA